MHIVVCLKQVADPLLPPQSLVLDRERWQIRGPQNTPPVTNGFDEQALEAALRLKDQVDGVAITALSLGGQFHVDVMKRALAVGADELVLVQDPALDTWDSHFLARVLARAIERLAPVDLVLCGRQASDWDHAQVPLALAEALGWPCLTVARKVEFVGGAVTVERVLADGFQEMSAPLPAVVTITSELGELRMPTVRGKMAAMRRQPRLVSLPELGETVAQAPAIRIEDLALPSTGRRCEFIAGADGAEVGRRLAEVLLAAGLVGPGPAGGG